MKKSYIIAMVFAGIIIVWMASGMLFKSSEETHVLMQKHTVSSEAIIVEVEVQKAELTVSNIIAQGNVEPNREVTLRAETLGKINEIILGEGSIVKENDVILTLEVNNRKARLAKAQSKTRKEMRKYEAIKNLDVKGYTSKTEFDAAYASLKSAQSEEKQIRLEIEKTSITAPFGGVIDKQKVEVGDYLSIGDEILTIVDNNPLIINTQISQHDIASIHKGQKAKVDLATGQKKEGIVSFISPKADKVTRTFRVEIKISNPDNLPSGISAVAEIPKKGVKTHFISPALLFLNENGKPSVKVINKNDVVELYPIKIVTAKSKGLYVSGLPDEARIIVAGQGFVSVGEKVKYKLKENKKVNK